MKVAEIRQIERKDVPIYYRRVYTGLAVLELLNKHYERRVEFSIETKPTGAKEVVVRLLEELDYPLIPLMRELREFVTALDKSGALTC